MIYRFRTNSENWLKNIKSSILNGSAQLCNYWCSEGNVYNKLNANKDLIKVHNEYERTQIVGVIVAWGKSNDSFPTLQFVPNNISLHKYNIDVNDIYNIDVNNGSLEVGKNIQGNAPKYKAPINSKYRNHSSHILNGMKPGYTVQDFKNEINRSLTAAHGYEISSPFAYLIFEPFCIGYNVKDDINIINQIKAFNKKNNNKIQEHGITVRDNGTIIFPR